VGYWITQSEPVEVQALALAQQLLVRQPRAARVLRSMALFAREVMPAFA
jgi:hypothetical protein